MQEEIARLQADLQELVPRKQELDQASKEIERKGHHGSLDLLEEFIGRQVAFTLDDGRVLEGKLLQNQLHCLKVETPENGTLVLNTLLVNVLTPLDTDTAQGKQTSS
jgi:hypothetical protein